MKTWSKKAFLPTLLVVALLLSLFSGCGSPAPSTSPAPEASTPGASAPAGAEPSSGSALSGKITLWGWEDVAFAEAIQRFNQKYPDIEVVYTPVGSSEYVQKIQTALATGTELPDVACLELDSRGKLMTLDCWENLENGQYSFDRTKVVDYLIPLMTDQKGAIVCVDWQLCPSGLAYKRSMAREYLGTDDPAELQKLLPTWDAFVEQGVKVKDATGGKIKMFAGLGDINRIVFNQVTSPIVADGKINVNDSFGSLFNVQANMRDAGIVGNLSIWSPAWAASFADREHMFYPCATWVPFFHIEANDPEGKGDWGMITPPGGAYNWGGTAFAITKQSQNKQAAWAFIEWMLFSDEGIAFNDEVTQYPTPYKAKYEDPAYISGSNEFFGGQNLKEMFFQTLLSDMRVRPISEYDVALWDIVGLETNDLAADPGLTAQQALEKAIQEVKNKMPELEIQQ